MAEGKKLKLSDKGRIVISALFSFLLYFVCLVVVVFYLIEK